MAIAKLSIVAMVCLGLAAFASAKTLRELKLNLTDLDTEQLGKCNMSLDIVDECGLQQGNSYRFDEFAYPTDQESLTNSCKRQADAFRCLRSYYKCLDNFPKQVLSAMVRSRDRFNDLICDKPTKFSNEFLQLGQCMRDNPEAKAKGASAEINSIILPEAITATKIDSVRDRIKHSCCSVEKVRREYLEATEPHCKKYSHVALKVIDSYLADTVGLICPTPPTEAECEKLPKLNTPKTSTHRFFIKPIIEVIKTLAPPS